MTQRSPQLAATRRDVSRLETDELFIRWRQDRDEAARNELVKRLLPIARRLARRYQGAREPLDDLVQVASLALVKAIDRFDYERGVSFASYAVPTIAGELKRYFRDCGWSVHVPRAAQEMALKVERGQRALAARSGHSPTVDELAVYLELSIEDVVDGLEAAAAHHSGSLDAPYETEDGENGTLGESIGAEDQRFEFITLGASIADAAQHLTEREREVLALRIFEDWTQTEIAERMGVSQMQISRTLRRTVNRLQELVDGPPDAKGTGR
jgi:RNA polymerase sigma-B factor